MSSSSTAIVQPSLFDQLTDIKRSLEAGLIDEDEAKARKKLILEGTSTASSTSDSSDPDREGLTKYFRDAELRTHQVWRRDYEKYVMIKEDWVSMPLEEKQAIFIDKAKAHLLSSTEVMLGIYLLWGGDKELEFLRSLLVSSSGAHRMLMHNFYVAEHREPSFLKTHGDKIPRLPDPLFPHTKEFSALNTMLLEEPVIGGGVERRSLFRSAEENDPLGGAPNFYVQTGPDGQSFVDMADVEQTCATMQRQIAALRTAQQSKGQGKPWYKKNKSNNNNYNNNYNNYNNNNNYQNSQYPNYQPQQQQQQQQQYQQQPAYKGNLMGAGEPPQTSPTSSQPATTAKRN